MSAFADRQLTRADLSPDQRRVYESLLDWSRRPRGVLTLGGYAGTGKSTLLGLFASETRLKVAYICFTGRASSVLGRKLRESNVRSTNRIQTDNEKRLEGRWGHLFFSPFSAEAERPFCGTIHRLIYRPLIDDKTEELLAWIKREILDRAYDLIVIDEASMVNTWIIEDIQRHGVPVLAVGDHGQLPPVMGDGSLMQNPDLRLEKIHRQAEGSPIIQLSRAIREEGRMDRSLADGKRLQFGQRNDFTHHMDKSLDTAILCWTNRMRVYVNKTIRIRMGLGGQWPRAGEPVIALRNYPPIYNGMRGTLTEDAVEPYKDQPWLLRTKIEFPEEGLTAEEHEICRQQFHRQKTFQSVDEMKEMGMNVFSMGQGGRLFDFGYALTVHKCVDPDTFVETPDGLLRAGSLSPSGQIATPFGRSAYRNLVRNTSRRMLEILTDDGYSLKVTRDHGVDVWCADNGYVRREAKDIEAGDIVRLRLGAEYKTGRGAPLPEGRPQDVRAKKYRLPSTCDETLAEFLGLMVADGTLYRRGFRLAKRHKDVADRFEFLCRKLFGASTSRFFKLGAHHVEVSSALIADWLRDVGGMAPKAVPECILVAPLDVQARFLRGIFEDGTVNLKGGKIDHIEFASTRPNVRQIVRTMLLRFGIVCGSTDSRPECIYIYGNYAKRFGKRIGFISRAKQSRLDANRAPNGTRYFFPLLRSEFHLAKSGLGLIQRHRAPRSLDDRKPFHHSKVRSVSSCRGPSVCVEVPDGHQFLQNGFCGWNSQGSQFKHAIVIVDWPQDYSNDKTRRLAYTAVTRAAEKLTVLL